MTAARPRTKRNNKKIPVKSAALGWAVIRGTPGMIVSGLAAEQLLAALRASGYGVGA